MGGHAKKYVPGVMRPIPNFRNLYLIMLWSVVVIERTWMDQVSQLNC